MANIFSYWDYGNNLINNVIIGVSKKGQEQSRSSWTQPDTTVIGLKIFLKVGMYPVKSELGQGNVLNTYFPK